MLSFEELEAEGAYEVSKQHGSKSLRLSGKPFPVSITKHEFDWIRESCKNHNQALEIATGTGVSSIAMSVIPVITIDSYIEEMSGSCDAYIQDYDYTQSYSYQNLKRMIEKYNLNIKQEVGVSPQDVGELVKKHTNYVDFVFIDAYHRDENLIWDISAIQPFLREKYRIVMHDLHCFSDNCLNSVEEMLGGKIVRVPELAYKKYGYNTGYVDGRK